MGMLSDPAEEMFCQEYTLTGNKAESARRAGYSARSAGTYAFRLLSKDRVIQRIEELKTVGLKKFEVSKEMLIEELAGIARADIKDYLSFEMVDDVQQIKIKSSDEIDGRKIQSVSIDKNGTFTFKLYDKLTAIEKLGKQLGMFKDQVEVTGELVIFAGKNDLED